MKCSWGQALHYGIWAMENIAARNAAARECPNARRQPTNQTVTHDSPYGIIFVDRGAGEMLSFCFGLRRYVGARFGWMRAGYARVGLRPSLRRADAANRAARAER